MDLVYLDEAGDVKVSQGNTNYFVLSSMIVPEENWNKVFEVTKEFRKHLYEEYGIPRKKELHARDFVRGRGRPSRTRIITKYERSVIFEMFLKKLSNLNELGVYSINVCVQNRPGQNSYDLAVDRMLNRIQRTLVERNRNGILIFDEGKEELVKRISRKMKVFNPIPSMFGAWEDGERTKNLTTDRIIGDPFFRDSADDYFIQYVDFIAFSLLKYKEEPTDQISKYKIHEMFPIIEPILYKQATRYNNLGIVMA